LGLYCAYLNDRGDGVEEIDDDGDEGGCGSNGGYWIEGSYGGGSFVNINVDSGTVTGLGYDSSGNPEVSLAGASGSNGSWGAWTQTFSQNTMVTVGQFNNTFFNPWKHVALQLGNGPFYGQAPKSTLAFLGHFLFGSPNTPGVPGTIETQNPSAMTNAITFPVSGEQAALMQGEINQSLQNPPPYDVYGPSPTCDCAFWIQNVLGGAGINSGAPTIYPSQLLWQLQQAIP